MANITTISWTDGDGDITGLTSDTAIENHGATYSNADGTIMVRALNADDAVALSL